MAQICLGTHRHPGPCPFRGLHQSDGTGKRPVRLGRVQAHEVALIPLILSGVVVWGPETSGHSTSSADVAVGGGWVRGDALPHNASPTPTWISWRVH